MDSSPPTPFPDILAPVLTGQDLADLRKSVGMTRAEMARRLRFSEPYLLEIERGTRRLSSLIRERYLREIDREKGTTE